ncbi:MAG TPA: DNA starvation/stationary phase protection protein Dps [Gammaproteobacteria bacterium]|nr:DNA starvation/stationary phase protection protein Dps [Gammaproteobacteria bacterium]
MQLEEPRMYTTKNSFPEKSRTQAIGILQQNLADATDLMHQAKQAHWNVKGPSFIALHELFDKIADASAEYADLIAERIMQFGGSAEGTVRMAAKRSHLPEYPLNITQGREHVQALSQALANFGESVRHAIDQADELGDKDTADIFTEISRGVDKYLWFVEAHNQADK